MRFALVGSRIPRLARWPRLPIVDLDKDRRNPGEVGIWPTTGLLTTLLYVHGYKEGVGCAPAGTDCSIRSDLGQPILFVQFFLALVANAVPVRGQERGSHSFNSTPVSCSFLAQYFL